MAISSELSFHYRFTANYTVTQHKQEDIEFRAPLK